MEKNNNIKVLCFSADNYSMNELKEMSKKDLYDLAAEEKSIGYDTADVLSPEDFSYLFNEGYVNSTTSYIFFVDMNELS